MRIAKYIAATLALVVSGWLLMAANGLRTILLDNAAGWHIYDVPSHPTALMVAYLVGGFSLPFLSAWLITTARVSVGEQRGAFWRRYLTGVILAFVGAFLIGGLLLFLTLALLDAGVI